MTKEKTENLLSEASDADKCWLVEGFDEQGKTFAIHLLSNFPTRIEARILLNCTLAILLTRFPRLAYLFHKGSMAATGERDIANTYAYAAKIQALANEISASRDMAHAEDRVAQQFKIAKAFFAGLPSNMIMTICEINKIPIDYDFAVRLANLNKESDDFDQALSFMEEFMQKVGNKSAVEILDNTVNVVSNNTVPYKLTSVCEEEDSTINIHSQTWEGIRKYCQAAWFVEKNSDKYKSIIKDLKRHGELLTMLEHQPDKIELCSWYEALNSRKDLTSMFFENVLNADLDSEEEQTILEFLSRHRLSAIAKREYAEFKNKHANAKEISFIEDKAIVTPLSHLEQWTEEKLQLLFRNLKKGGFIASKTQDDDFLAVFGCTTAKYPLDLEPIRWTGTYRGKPGVKQIIDLLSLMGYKCDELKGGDLLKDLNSCFAVGEGFKSNSFQRGTESDKHETLAEIVEKCLKK